jgi:chorismate mutase
LKDLLPLSSWRHPFTAPLYIAGPCSAESREQVLEAAKQLSLMPKVQLFRAGIWKPRTRPGHFEGVGEVGLNWLKEAKDSFSLKIATEVALPSHVELCLKYGVDVLWVGARTTASPFAIDELAESLKGINIPVLVKNPINDELSLWIGALERFYSKGLRQLGAIHRGFHIPDQTHYRNSPLWRIPLELKRQFPHLPLICDPSHICGKRSPLTKISLMSMDLGMDGLMIETHPTPDLALSDASQQITPKELEALLGEVENKKSSDKSSPFQASLEQLRLKIDRMDEEILEALKLRTDFVLKIGKLKQEHKVTPFQVGRMDQLLKARKELAQELGLSPTFVHELFSLIHEESVRLQSKFNIIEEES